MAEAWVWPIFERWSWFLESLHPMWSTSGRIRAQQRRLRQLAQRLVYFFPIAKISENIWIGPTISNFQRLPQDWAKETKNSRHEMISAKARRPQRSSSWQFASRTSTMRSGPQHQRSHLMKRQRSRTKQNLRTSSYKSPQMWYMTITQRRRMTITKAQISSILPETRSLHASPLTILRQITISKTIRYSLRMKLKMKQIKKLARNYKTILTKKPSKMTTWRAQSKLLKRFNLNLEKCSMIFKILLKGIRARINRSKLPRMRSI